VLFDFTSPEEITGWTAVDDVVMGGMSGSAFAGGEASVAVFSGTVSLEQGGGFASVRAPIPAGALRGCGGIELRVRGDGKQYKVNLRVDKEFDGIPYQGEFSTINGEWETLRIPFADFHPVFRGRAVAAAPVLDPAKVCSFGFLISGRQDGRFRLEIDYILAYPTM
jgi:NADH dehydrogenase [ubiquinone] 1 alpha subcomplex assembly factor 1